MAGIGDNATDPVSEAVAPNILSGHVAPGTLKKKLPKCSVDTLQYKGKYKFPYDLRHIRRKETVDKKGHTSHVEVPNPDVKQGSEPDISSESSLSEPDISSQSSLLGASLNNEPPNNTADAEPQLLPKSVNTLQLIQDPGRQSPDSHQQVRGGGLTSVRDFQGHSCVPTQGRGVSSGRWVHPGGGGRNHDNKLPPLCQGHLKSNNNRTPPLSHLHPEDNSPKVLTKSSRLPSTWREVRYEILFLVRRLFDIDLSSINRPEKLTTKMDSFIYQCLCGAVDDDSYTFICRYEDRGYDAFKFLDRVNNICNKDSYQCMYWRAVNGCPPIYNVCGYPDHRYLCQGQSIIRQHTHTPSVGQGNTETPSQGRGGTPIQNNNIDAAADRYIQMSCARCLSNDGTHTAKDCHSISYCHKCGNWSHLTSECRGVYSCK